MDCACERRGHGAHTMPFHASAQLLLEKMVKGVSRFSKGQQVHVRQVLTSRALLPAALPKLAQPGPSQEE